MSDIRTFFFTFWIAFVVAFLLIVPAKADWIALQAVDVQATKFFPGGVDPLVTQNGLPNRGLGTNISLNLNTTVLQYIYWDSVVHGTTDSYLSTNSEGQFRSIGLQMRLGLQLTDNVQIGYVHHSQHVLDTNNALGPFPREDGVQLNIRVFSSKTSREGIF